MRRRLCLPVCLVLVILLTGLAFGDAPDPADATIDSRVLKIVDGDTVDIRGSTRVRYLNIDTPEIGQPYADLATELNRQLVRFKDVRLELDLKERDAYNRLLAYVYVETDSGWVMANLELVRAGLARLLFIPPNGRYRAEFEEALLDAMIHRRGMWGAVGGVLTVAELEAEIGENVNQVVTVRFTVATLSITAAGTRVDPTETGLGFHLLLLPACEAIALEAGTEILATGLLDYSSLRSGPVLRVDDPTQIVFVRDATPAASP
jgi:micrococcal nuclease